MEADYAKRRDRLREALYAHNVDAMLVSSAANRFYLSGFELHDVQSDESAGVLVIASDGRTYLLTDPRYADAAKRCFSDDEIRIYTKDSMALLGATLRSCGKSIALETKQCSLAFCRSLHEKQPDLAFVSGDGWVEELRAVKDAYEIACLEESFALNHTLLLWIEDELRHGMDEAKIAWKIESFFREHGAQELAFPSIVAVNQNAALPHAIPGETLLTDNALILLDVGCRVRNYCSDQTRTLWFGGSPSKRFEEVYALVREAQVAAISSMKPGEPASQVYARARSVFEKHGCQDHFTHGLGHGVGLATHEAPSLSSRSQTILLPGHVVTVEPGLYYPDWGGVRIEFTVLVTDDGVRIL
ncbi:MAG: aminopeptidase P family protein [Desulfovibrio sp.]|nr:aminopeptidase P family protein [Desulfovibrio sp.]